jgi:hypothetical protein
MAKGHTVYRASYCVPCVQWLNGATVWEIINGYTFIWYSSEWCGNWWLMVQWASKKKISGTGVY